LCSLIPDLSVKLSDPAGARALSIDDDPGLVVDEIIGSVSCCAQAHDSAEARLKWALERQGTLQIDDSCRVYRSEFYDAALHAKT
jgi:hypothetical protein